MAGVSAVHRRALQAKLLDLISKLPPAQIQNRLMANTDRDLALAFSGLGSDAIDSVLRRISASKAGRVRDELSLHEHRHIDPEHSVRAIQTVIASIENNHAVRGDRSYLRPRKPGRHGTGPGN